MIVYLSGMENGANKNILLMDVLKKYRPSIMQSFYKEKECVLNNISDDIMIDSGAYSMLKDKRKSNIDIYKYADRYAEFIKRNNIRLYVELDLDSIIGYANVLKIRNDLQKKTGIQPIPVWHKRLGIDEYRRMCKEYGYVGIGGLAIKEIKRNEYSHLKTLIRIAHDYGAKVHGLGFTYTRIMPLYKFDSVDSSTWVYGKKFSCVAYFTGKYMTQLHRTRLTGKNLYMKNTYEVEAHDVYEWIKYQKYAKQYL